MCVLRVPGSTSYWGGWQVHYGVDRWLVVKLPRCYTNQLIDAKKEQARARLRYMPCRAAAAKPDALSHGRAARVKRANESTANASEYSRCSVGLSAPPALSVCMSALPLFVCLTVYLPV